MFSNITEIISEFFSDIKYEAFSELGINAEIMGKNTFLKLEMFKDKKAVLKCNNLLVNSGQKEIETFLNSASGSG